MNAVYFMMPFILFGGLTLAKHEGIERGKCNALEAKHSYKPFDGCYVMRGDFTCWEKTNLDS